MITAPPGVAAALGDAGKRQGDRRRLAVITEHVGDIGGPLLIDGLDLRDGRGSPPVEATKERNRPRLALTAPGCTVAASAASNADTAAWA
ncbi:hypothetical protein J113_10825 [Mycobacterium tuberculosis CAS/NITR204]|uniref:Uncharacterized protein n=1 Tax=Mycobacterium tuberculosis CAS/NITR204 TaxID=1310114 RepID=R4M881_MYCTX|nr:hypothetical protein J113_10825 [Mycobacterium tuberculosis CAS/NITR204]